MKNKYGTVPSLRLDVIIGEALNLSRTKVKALIDGDKVAVNSAASSSSHYQVSEGDVISVKRFWKIYFLWKFRKNKKRQATDSYRKILLICRRGLWLFTKRDKEP